MPRQVPQTPPTPPPSSRSSNHGSRLLIPAAEGILRSLSHRPVSSSALVTRNPNLCQRKRRPAALADPHTHTHTRTHTHTHTHTHTRTHAHAHTDTHTHGFRRRLARSRTQIGRRGVSPRPPAGHRPPRPPPPAGPRARRPPQAPAPAPGCAAPPARFGQVKEPVSAASCDPNQLGLWLNALLHQKMAHTPRIARAGQVKEPVSAAGCECVRVQQVEVACASVLPRQEALAL